MNCRGKTRPNGRDYCVTCNRSWRGGCIDDKTLEDDVRPPALPSSRVSTYYMRRDTRAGRVHAIVKDS